MKPMKSVFDWFGIGAWIAAAICAFAAPVSAAHDQASREVLQREIVVGSELDYPPYALVTKDGEADGFSVDLMKAVCETMGLKVHFRTGPWSEMRSALEKGEIDALPLVSYSKEREAVFDFTFPHTVAYGVAFRRNGGKDVKNTNDLRDKTIVVMRSDAAHDWLVRNDISNSLILTETVDESLRLLASGKGDFALVPRLVGLITAKDLNLDTIEPTELLIDAYGRGYGFAVKEGNAELLHVLNEGLSIIERDGTYGRIYDKWFATVDPRGVPTETVVRYALFGLLAIAVVGGMVVAWIAVLRKTVRKVTEDLQKANDGLETQVTARTRELKDRNFILDAVIEGSQDAIFVKDHDGRFLHVNGVIAQNFGMAPDEFLGKDDTYIFPPALAAETMARDRAVLETGKVIEVEEVIPIKGEKRIFHVYKIPYRSDEGNIIGVIGIVRDITDHRRSEAEAKQHHEETEGLLGAARAVLECHRFTDAARRIFDASRAVTGAESGYVALLSEDGEENEVLFLEAGNLPCNVDPDLPMPIRGLRAEAYASGKVVFDNDFMNSEWIEFLPAGHVEMRNVLFAPLVIDGKVVGIMGLANKPTDFTKNDARIAGAFGNLAAIALSRVRSEDTLRQSDAHLRSIMDNAPVAIFLKDLHGRILAANKTHLERRGVTVEQVVNRTSYDYTVKPIADEITSQERSVMEARKPRTFEVTRKLPIGDRDLMVVRFPIIAGDGAVIGVGGISIDVTDHSVMERKLIQAQKMEVVGQLTGGVAHDFNNLLQVIETNLELARTEIARGGTANDLLEGALHAGRRGAKLTHQLLAFSRKQTLRPARIDFGPMIDGLRTMLSRTLGEDIALETVVADNTHAVEVDENGLMNALLNLAINSKAAMPDGGRLMIAVRNRWFEHGIALESDRLAAGDYVEIAVTDTGTGMSEETAQHAFEPFFTTKEVGLGSGLGLSMVYGFTRQSGGNVTIESELGVGTTVRMVLPAIGGQAMVAAGADVIEKIHGHTAKVLLVEDDEDVRSAAVRLLASFGCDVIEAESAAPALEILKGDGLIDLLFSDVVLPGGKNGFELATEAMRLQPNLKVILASGYPEAAWRKTIETDFFLLAKPYTKPTLSDALRKVLYNCG